ncbi:hypothetical protein [Streptomyces purpureus]|uniref:Uncharacterized protein n=2 Tax=Streptomyces purpureus TaxID=1951 RepID=A0A918LLM9_9ACTN|nr:hypothetical protein [Streptomyces purpureus]GGT13679.1 hypothetical protein GCM10014713_02790 [Streptomyces purpureus]
MPLSLLFLALFALAFLAFNVALCVRVWRLTELPPWRRALPALLLCCALAASIGRAWGVTAVAEAVALPLNVATALLGMFELGRHRRRTGTGAPETSA